METDRDSARVVGSAMHDPACSGAILAGGRSSRMGADKALCELDGQTFWERQWLLLDSLGVRERFVCGPRRAEFPAEVECIGDAAAERGPLGGVVAALERAQEARVLVLAVDMPRLTVEDMAKLLQAAGGFGCVPFTEEGGRRFYEPLAAVYPKRSAAVARACLEGADWSLQGFARAGVAAGWLREYRLSSEARERFRSLNRPSDLGSK